MKTNRKKAKRTAKKVGICMISIGIIFEIIGLISIFLCPQLYLWTLILVGFLLAFLSIGFLSIGFSKEIADYGMNELSPILNSLKKETSDTKGNIKCYYCNSENEQDSKFCKGVRKTSI